MSHDVVGLSVQLGVFVNEMMVRFRAMSACWARDMQLSLHVCPYMTGKADLAVHLDVGITWLVCTNSAATDSLLIKPIVG